MNAKKKILEELITKLLGHGEDPEEFEMWSKIFDCLNREQQEKLINTLQKELEQLQAIRI
ncbi:MAG: hypothetical protein Q8R55_00260 [Candidatus Taylorbacteria bacterium]|nr:hypothetical protein [Candidatus Taylorbacteria bacterium]